MTPRPCRTISNLPRNSASSRTSTISRRRKNPLQAWLHDHGDDLVRQYDAILADNHAVDFTDLITGAYDFLTDEACCQRWRDRFRFIAVDEMQDTSEVEYAVISRLFPGRNVLLCGDYFQTIYEWRGSYPEYILEQFRKTYHPREITFTTNYRATQLLLKAAEGCLNRLFGQVTVHHIYPQPGQAAAAVPGDPSSSIRRTTSSAKAAGSSRN